MHWIDYQIKGKEKKRKNGKQSERRGEKRRGKKRRGEVRGELSNKSERMYIEGKKWKKFHLRGALNNTVFSFCDNQFLIQILL